MVRAIMAAIGILLLILILFLPNSPDILSWVAVSLIIPGFITIIIRILRYFIKHPSWKEDDPIESQKIAEQAALKEEREAKLKEQEELVRRYSQSQLTREVVQFLCSGTHEQSPPEIIRIYDDRIEGISQGKVRVFDFAAHGIHSFRFVVYTLKSKDDINYLVRPQIAMAEAINGLMDNQYIIADMAEKENKSEYDSDLGYLYRIQYTSKYVHMELTSALPSQYF